MKASVVGSETSTRPVQDSLPPDLFDWEWLQAWAASQGFGAVLGTALLAGVKGVLLPAQYSLRDRLLCQVPGWFCLFG